MWEQQYLIPSTSKTILYDKSFKSKSYSKLLRSHTANPLGRTGLKLSIPFIKCWRSRCFPKDILLSMISTDDRADLAVPTDEYPTPDSNILFRNSIGWLKMLKWDQYPFHDKTLSISQCSGHIFWLSRDAYSAVWS